MGVLDRPVFCPDSGDSLFVPPLNTVAGALSNEASQLGDCALAFGLRAFECGWTKRRRKARIEHSGQSGVIMKQTAMVWRMIHGAQALVQEVAWAFGVHAGPACTVDLLERLFRVRAVRVRSDGDRFSNLMR